MARPCSICTHQEREAIDKALISGTAYRKIAEHYGTSEAALSRHKNNHLADTIAKAQEVAKANGIEIVKAREAGELEHALDVVAELRQINTASREVLAEARAAKDGDLALKAVDRLHRQIELQAKLIGELDAGARVNVTLAPQWVAIRTVMMDALEAYPDARVAVAGALMEIEDDATGD